MPCRAWKLASGAERSPTYSREVIDVTAGRSSDPSAAGLGMRQWASGVEPRARRDGRMAIRRPTASRPLRFPRNPHLPPACFTWRPTIGDPCRPAGSRPCRMTPPPCPIPPPTSAPLSRPCARRSRPVGSTPWLMPSSTLAATTPATCSPWRPIEPLPATRPRTATPSRRWPRWKPIWRTIGRHPVSTPRIGKLTAG